MRFTPKSDAELYKMLPKGDYDFEISQAEETTSKSSGKEMLVVTLKVFGTDKQHVLKDYIVDNAKLKRFCQAIGMERAYEEGELPADAIVGHSGICKVDIEQSEQYGDRNKIVGYVPRKSEKSEQGKNHLLTGVDAGQQRRANAELKTATAEEDIPF